MKRKNLAVLTVLLLLSVALLSGCVSLDNNRTSENYHFGRYFYGENTFLSVGDTLTLDVRRIFNMSGLEAYPDFSRGYSLYSSNTKVVTVRGDKVTAHACGTAYIGIVFRGKNIVQRATVATVFVTDEGAIVEIRTAQDLFNIRKDLKGFYILKNDIDLANWGNWMPIADYVTCMADQLEGVFSGMLINPYGYKISNLKITPAGHENDDFAFLCAGLFGVVGTSYSPALIDGLILENVLIDNSDVELDGNFYARAGAIAGAISSGSVVQNCKVSGKITSGFFAGGITGFGGSCFISDCLFIGDVQMPENKQMSGYAGGIAGSYVRSGVYGKETPKFGELEKCTVLGNIISFYFADGICGNQTTDSFRGCLFSGNIQSSPTQYHNE